MVYNYNNVGYSYGGLMFMTDFEKMVIERFDSLDNRLDSLGKDVRAIKVELENHVDKMLSELTGRQIDNSERLQTIEKDVEEIKDSLVATEILQGIKTNNLM